MTNLERPAVSAGGRWRLALLILVFLSGIGLIVAGGLAAGGPDRAMIVAGSVLNAIGTVGATGFRRNRRL